MPTIKQVAELANVSIGTVSHVLGGRVPVSEDLRRKVQAAIRTLDYHPNHIARSLKTTKTHLLGMVVPDMTIPFFSQLIRSAEAAAKKAGYWVMAVNSDDDPERQQSVLSLLRSQRVEGILLVSASGKGSKGQINRLQASGLPVVCLDRVPKGVDVDSVCLEDVEAARMGTVHLIERGHQDIAILTGPLVLRNERERLQGYKKALRTAGIPLNKDLIWEASLTVEDVMRSTAERLTTQANRPTALFCTNGVTGMGALQGLSACRLATPRDLAFLTFDELSPDGLFRPTLTSIVQPAALLGETAAEVLLERLRTGGGGRTTVEARFKASLKIGESTATRLRQPAIAIRA